MVRIRMKRMGRTHRPFYRINAIDQRSQRDGAVIENLGWYDPMATQDKQINLKEERIRHWLSQGAQPSDTVRDILGHHDLLPPRAKAKWEADRKAARERVQAKLDAKAAEEAAAKAAEEEAARAAEAAKAAAEAAKAAEAQPAEDTPAES